MISKFRNIISPKLINEIENKVYNIEDILLNHFIKNEVRESETEDEKKVKYDELATLDSFVPVLHDLLSKYKYGNDNDLYQRICWKKAAFIEGADNIQKSNGPMSDAFKKYDSKNKIWQALQTPVPTTAAPSNPANHIYKINNVFNIDGEYKDDKGIVARFNQILYNYLHEFYDNSTKKIYAPLFNKLAEQTFSSIVYGKGIADIGATQLGLVADAYEMPSFIGNSNNTPKNNIVLFSSIAFTMKQLLTRSLDPKGTVKYHTIPNLNEVSPHMVEEYRAKLPVFIKLFKLLIKKCMLYKQVLENNIGTKVTTIEIQLPVIPNDVTDELGNKIDIMEGFKHVEGETSKDERADDYKQILNNVMEGCTTLIKDATNVLDEVKAMDGKSGLFFELKMDFIKDYYTNTETLPFMPSSSILHALSLKGNVDDTEFEAAKRDLYLAKQAERDLPILANIDEVNAASRAIIIAQAAYDTILRDDNSDLMLTNHKLHTPKFKFLYGTRSVLNGEKQGIKQMPYMSELSNKYNTSMRAANQIDTKNLEKIIEQLVCFTRYSTDVYYYKKLLSFKPISKAFIPNARALADGEDGPVPENRMVTFAEINNTESVIDITQNTFITNNKEKLFNYVQKLYQHEGDDTEIMTHKTRDYARLLNIVDVNVVPINIHALMKEVPLANLYNYNISFDSMINKEFGIRDDLPTEVKLFRDLLIKPYMPLITPASAGVLAGLVDGVSNVFNGDIKDLHLFKPRFISDQLWSSGTDDKPKCNIRDIDNGRLNTKIVRDTVWFVNIQRMLRRKIRNELSEIKTRVVESNKVTSRQLTDYSGEHAEYKEGEFDEFTW